MTGTNKQALEVDGRCVCEAYTARTQDFYRMVGVCVNCGSTPIIMTFRVGYRTQYLTCPVCGTTRTVQPQRLLEIDECQPEAESRTACDARA